MIAWMLYAVLVATLLTLGAYAADRMLRLHGRPTRWVWIVSLVASFAVPAIWPRLPRTSAAEAAADFVPPSFSIQLDAITPSAVASAAWPLGRLLLLGWLALSAALVVYGVYAVLRLRSVRTRWQPGEVAGQAVLVSRDVGPAVIGFLRPAVVVPDWVCSLPSKDQRLILAHEDAHIAARDPWLVIVAHILPALMPWNATVWLQAKRLREAIELDCDARLLAGTTNRHGYAELLLNVGGRTTTSAPFAVAALSEPRSLLEKRIRRMFERRPRYRVLRASAWATVAGLAVVAAFQAPLPGEPLPSALTTTEQEVGSLVSAADTTPPKLLNPAEVREATRQHYPLQLRESGVEGMPRVWLQITDEGEVASARLRRSSGNSAIDEAALKVAGVMRFAPAQFNGRPVASTTEVNIEFSRAAEAGLLVQVPRFPDLKREKTVPAKPSTAAVASAPSSVPVLQNLGEVAEAQARVYPVELRQAGIGGRVNVWFYVDETGTVTKTMLKSSSGLKTLDEAALKIADVLKFSPAMKDSRAVADWVEVPIDFRPAESLQPVQQVTAVRAKMAEAPTFTPYTVKPTLANADAVKESLDRYYPRLLRDAGIEGTANIWFFIDETGRVAKLQLKSSTGHQALDEAALKVGSMMQFKPAMNRDMAVPVWVDMPIVFKAQQEVPRQQEMARLQEIARARVESERAGTGGGGRGVRQGAGGEEPKRATAQAREAAVEEPTSAFARARETGGGGRGSVALSATRRPANADAVVRSLQRYYPPLLRDAGIGGTARFTVVLDPDGTPVKIGLRESSGHEALDAAARKVLEIARWAPTGESGLIEIDVPITFKTN